MLGLVIAVAAAPVAAELPRIVAKLRAEHGCAGPDSEQRVSYVALDQERTLILLSCGVGASRRSSLPIIATTRGLRFITALARSTAARPRRTGRAADAGERELGCAKRHPLERRHRRPPRLYLGWRALPPGQIKRDG